ncbi:uncharacterized protein LOC110269236 [Arachis ipaensis]|uniref:uncharacterized protein LOC110269236 n=1 Tax=Arachis ipaensis TaxID=130454 RepID=UPI000A2B12F4|nr:uncharacterized protein LOC110269236 [Arachis ipaensis]
MPIINHASRSGTTLQERSPEEPSSSQTTQDENVVEVEDVDDEDEVPKYAKFLKDLCMNKERIHDLETIPLGSSISALMGAIPEKCGDPVPCMLPPLKRSAACFVLADKSIISVVGIAKDVLVSIKGLIFPIDFYILEMLPNDSGRPSSIFLGRPFLKTSRFKLDAFLSTYSFEIDGRVVSFNLNEAMKHPPKDHSIFQCNIIDEIVAEIHKDIVDERNMVQGASVEKLLEYTKDTLSPLEPNIVSRIRARYPEGKS